MFHYLKYTLFHLLVLPLMFGLTMGGNALYLGFFVAVFFIVIGDALFGDDESTPVYKHKWILTFQLYLSLPLVIAINFLLLWSFSNHDPLGYGTYIQSVSGFDVLANRETTSFMGYVFAILACGLMTAVVGTNVGHELTHRTSNPVAMFIGRWLLAFSWDTGFSIEHVYGHHIYVGAEMDPATAPRGRNVYQHIVASTIKGNKSAWNLEKLRLQRRNKKLMSLNNRFFRGLLMSLFLELIAFLISAWMGVLIFTVSALIAKSFLEIVNYMEHYGIVRNPDTPVQPYHSWNTNKRISSWATFNLTRHSHHHAQGDAPFYNLKPYKDVPMMVSGYLTTIFLTLLPPLWNVIMADKILDWDKRFASKEELSLASIANAKSGVKKLQDVSY